MAHEAFDLVYRGGSEPYFFSEGSKPQQIDYRHMHLDFLKNAASILGTNYDLTTSIDLRQIKELGKQVFKGSPVSYINNGFITLYYDYQAGHLDSELIVREPEARAAEYYDEHILKPITDYICQYTMPALLDYIESHPMRDRIIFDPNQDFGCGVMGTTEQKFIIDA